MNDLSICGVLLKLWLYSSFVLVCMTQASLERYLNRSNDALSSYFGGLGGCLSVTRSRKRLNLTPIRLLDKGCT